MSEPSDRIVFLHTFSKGNLSRRKARSRVDSVVMPDFKTIERSMEQLEREKE